MTQIIENEYELSKKEAFSKDQSLRLKRAKSKDTHPEILYYLASDPDQEVRLAVASNKSTPYHTIKILAEDHSKEIRKIAVKLLKQNLKILEKEQDEKRQFMIEKIIETLSRDQSAQIRHVLVETIKDVEFVPHSVAMRLAADIDQKVAEPMLKEFKNFTDEDLISILENHDELWRFENVADREALSLKLASFLVDSGHISVLKKLLARKKLVLPEAELKKIVRVAERHDEMESHIVNYRSLPGKLARKLVKFVGQSVLKTLMRRSDFDTETIAEIKKIAKRRLEWLDKEKSYTDPKSMAVALYQSHELDEEMLSDALSWKKNEFAMIALTLLADSTLDLIAGIFRIKSQKAMMGLAWAIGFSAKFGVLLQKKLGEIHPRDLLNPKHGKDFPLSEDDMLWQLDFFDIHVEKK